MPYPLNSTGATAIDMSRLPVPSATPMQQRCQGLLSGAGIFRAIADHPEVGIYQRCGVAFARVTTYAEQKVLRLDEIAVSRLEKLVQDDDELMSEDQLDEIMSPNIRALSEYCMCSGHPTFSPYINQSCRPNVQV